MKREIIKTGDGSTTIYLPNWNEHYHSKHGAIQEARHVFIEMGLKKALKSDLQQISILEIGFGTGLNALVTWQEVKNRDIKIIYTGIEAYPVTQEEIDNLNFPAEIKEEGAISFFKNMHSASWENQHEISKFFKFTKQKKFFQEIEFQAEFDLLYFDAFGARVQPDLWTEAIFEKMYDALKPGGILVTYAAKGSVRRAMLAMGFLVERLPGPPGKREMLRSVKPSGQG